MNATKKTARLAALLSVFIFTVMLAKADAFASPSPLVELTLGPNTKVYGLTAMNSLGKKTGTLKEFADTVVNGNTKSCTLFPANFFNAYDDTKEIVGGIYSQGQVVYDSWFDYGCGFDAGNNFYMFKLPSYVANEEGGKIVAQNLYGMDAEIVTAFDCYPWLIHNGVPLEISPFPGANEQYLNGKVQRAFMGQKADGAFVYGMLSGSDMRDTQQACVDLGLINAVNVDGGASCGVYQDGQYLAAPGRELASVVCVVEENAPVYPWEVPPGTVPFPGAVTASPAAAPVFINGTQVLFDIYNIGGSNYVKLRDMAFALNGTASQFAVTVDNDVINLILNAPYTPVGGEMTPGDGIARQAAPTQNPLRLNGFPLALQAYNIGGNNYFKLADIAAVFGFSAAFENGAVIITTP